MDSIEKLVDKQPRYIVIYDDIKFILMYIINICFQLYALISIFSKDIILFLFKHIKNDWIPLNLEFSYVNSIFDDIDDDDIDIDGIDNNVINNIDDDIEISKYDSFFTKEKETDIEYITLDNIYSKFKTDNTKPLIKLSENNSYKIIQSDLITFKKGEKDKLIPKIITITNKLNLFCYLFKTFNLADIKYFTDDKQSYLFIFYKMNNEYKTVLIDCNKNYNIVSKKYIFFGAVNL